MSPVASPTAPSCIARSTSSFICFCSSAVGLRASSPITFERTELWPMSVEILIASGFSLMRPRNSPTSVTEPPQFPVTNVVTPIR